MIVVSDTSPLCYLTLIGCVEVLPRLFGEVVVPHLVWTELAHRDSPELVRRFVATPPAWLKIYDDVPQQQPMPRRIHAGETSAILLALELHADGLLMDDLRGRVVAEARGLRVTGTLGVLRLAARNGHLELADAFVRLRQTNFRAAESVYQTLLAEERERLRRQG